MKTLLRLTAVLLLLAVAAGGYFWYLVTQPYQGYQGAKIIDFPRGTSTFEMSQLLQSEGVIRSSRLFQLARYVSPGAHLQAGEYKFDKPASVMDVLRKIARGDTFY